MFLFSVASIARRVIQASDTPHRLREFFSAKWLRAQLRAPLASVSGRPGRHSTGSGTSAQTARWSWRHVSSSRSSASPVMPLPFALVVNVPSQRVFPGTLWHALVPTGIYHDEFKYKDQIIFISTVQQPLYFRSCCHSYQVLRTPISYPGTAK